MGNPLQELGHEDPVALYEIKSGETVEDGDLLAVNSSGTVQRAADASGLKVVGVATDVRDGKCECVCGVLQVGNDTTNALARKDRGGVAYVKDKATVDSSGGTNKVAAGLVVDVDASGVWIDCRPAAVAAAMALAAANS